MIFLKYVINSLRISYNILWPIPRFYSFPFVPPNLFLLIHSLAYLLFAQELINYDLCPPYISRCGNIYWSMTKMPIPITCKQTDSLSPRRHQVSISLQLGVMAQELLFPWCKSVYLLYLTGDNFFFYFHNLPSIFLVSVFLPDE